MRVCGKLSVLTILYIIFVGVYGFGLITVSGVWFLNGALLIALDWMINRNPPIMFWREFDSEAIRFNYYFAKLAKK